jgi:hypothetical protein
LKCTREREREEGGRERNRWKTQVQENLYSYVVLSTNLHHGILHKFVYVPVVLHGILIVKITTESEHDVLRSVVASLKENILDEGINSLIHIVVHQVRVVLKRDYKNHTCKFSIKDPRDNSSASRYHIYK